MTEPLLIARADGVLRLTLNRPERLNALTAGLLAQLHDALVAARLDPDVRAILLAGAGRGFCAGHDLLEHDKSVWSPPAAGDPPDAPIRPEHATARLIHDAEIPMMLRGIAKPVIAAIRGPAAGSGLVLAAACDLRITSETAVFKTGFVSAGRCGDPGGSYLLSRLVGPAKARELYLLDEKIGAQEALRIGLVTRVVADAALDGEAEALARRMANGPSLAYAGIKRNLAAAETGSFHELIAAEAATNVHASLSADGAEAAAAFAERRPPRFTGR